MEHKYISPFLLLFFQGFFGILLTLITYQIALFVPCKEKWLFCSTGPIFESFDNDFRNGFLNKNARFATYEEVKQYFQSVCLMVGIKGQTKEMIKKDIDIVLKNFDYATINIFTPNTTPIERDEELIEWFSKEYRFLEKYDHIEVLFENTDFGVGD